MPLLISDLESEGQESATASSRSEHLVCLSRKSQEREGSYTDQSETEAHWLDRAVFQKANPPKPTAAQSNFVG